MSKRIILGTKCLRFNSTGSAGPEVRQNTHTIHMDHLVTAGKKLEENSQITSIRLIKVSIVVLALSFTLAFFLKRGNLLVLALLY